MGSIVGKQSGHYTTVHPCTEPQAENSGIDITPCFATAYDNMREDTNQGNLYSIPPRGGEHNSLNNDSKVTYNSDPVKGWPESGTDSAKTPKISPELQQIIDHWGSLPEHIKQTIKTLAGLTESK